MGYVLDPAGTMQDEVRRVAAERLGAAIEQLEAVGSGTVDAETAVHDVRKRCKETRGLARLVRPALGDGFRPFDALVRNAANHLSATRDAHALLATLDRLLDAHDLDDRLASVRDHQASVAAAATIEIEAGNEGIAAARDLLIEARKRSQHWELPDDVESIADGLDATYRAGHRALRSAERRLSDEHMHEWRKSVKYLWYQMRLLRDASPSVIEPLIDQLDHLADALGDDHDLAVLVASLNADAARFGTPDIVAHACEVARAQQHDLRIPALRAGAVVYTERPRAFRSRVMRYWRLTSESGPELPTGGIEAPAPSTVEPSISTIERERKFVIDAIPADLDLSDRCDLRQGYLVADDGASVRVRDSGPKGFTLTVKAGRGAERTELEWAIDRTQFDAAWPHTAGRRVVKTRHRIALDRHVVELDVFAEDLHGLVFAEVEFDSRDDLDAFEPPDWFGLEVTDDGRYTNASLALRGRPEEDS